MAAALDDVGRAKIRRQLPPLEVPRSSKSKILTVAWPETAGVPERVALMENLGRMRALHGAVVAAMVGSGNGLAINIVISPKI